MKVWELIQELEKLPAGKVVKICGETKYGAAVTGDYLVCERPGAVEITFSFDEINK